MSARPGTLRWIAIAVVVGGALAVVAVMRGGLLGLPAVPGGVSAQRAGLDLGALRARAARLEQAAATGADPDTALATAGRGLAAIRRGDTAAGLATMREAVALAPEDLVVGNAFRMAVLHERQARLGEAAGGAGPEQERSASMPDLGPLSIDTFEAVRRDHPCREADLQLALAWVDEILLFRALEIAAPASVESVNLLDAVLAEDPVYVPALFGRGLNYLHRPSRLVWPEARKAAPDAASRDLGMCVAIGRRVGGGPPRLVGTLALCLGDAYAKEGRHERARSWWQIARNTDADPALRAAVDRRFGWRDEEMLDRLEAELEQRMQDFDDPLTDLAVMWRGEAQ